MAMNNRGLGRGIQALFEGNGEEIVENGAVNSPLRMVSVDAIAPNPAQPRQVFADDELDNLAASIAAHGVLQPLLVRPFGEEGSYQLIAGERRLRAARKAGLAEVPVLSRNLDEQEALIVTLLENLQREDLNPIEEAKGLDALKNAMNASVDELAATLGQGRSTIAHSLRLLKLEPVIQDDIAAGRLTTSHAKCLGALPPGEDLMKLRQRIIDNGMTTRSTEEAVAFWNDHGHFPWEEEGEMTEDMADKTARETENTTGGENAKRPARIQDPDMLKLASHIGAVLNCRAKVSGTPSKGRISIIYDSNTQLFDLLEKLGLQLLP